jgi:hypothetical protein
MPKPLYNGSHEPTTPVPHPAPPQPPRTSWLPKGPARKRAFRKVRIDSIEVGKVILSSGTSEVLSVTHEVKQSTLEQNGKIVGLQMSDRKFTTTHRMGKKTFFIDGLELTRFNGKKIKVYGTINADLASTEITAGTSSNKPGTIIYRNLYGGSGDFQNVKGFLEYVKTDNESYNIFYIYSL